MLGLALDGLTGARGNPSVSSLSSMWSSSACTRSSFCGCIFQKPRVSCSFQWRTSFFSSSIVMIAESASVCVSVGENVIARLSGARASASSKSSLRRLRGTTRARARARARASARSERKRGGARARATHTRARAGSRGINAQGARAHSSSRCARSARREQLGRRPRTSRSSLRRLQARRERRRLCSKSDRLHKSERASGARAFGFTRWNASTPPRREQPT